MQSYLIGRPRKVLLLSFTVERSKTACAQAIEQMRRVIEVLGEAFILRLSLDGQTRWDEERESDSKETKRVRNKFSSN